MTSVELLENLVVVKDKYVLEAHREDISDSTIIQFNHSSRSGRHIPMKRSLLIAAIAAMMLMLVGCAIALMKLHELKVGEYSYKRPNPKNPSEMLNVTSEFISMQGIQGSKEYLATKEWQDYLDNYDRDGAILDSIGNNPTNLNGMDIFYRVYTQEMYNKLEEIAEKYGLKLHCDMNVVYSEELEAQVGGAFIGEGLSPGTAYIFDDGTFQFDGDTLINDTKVGFQFRRSVKGILDEPVLNVGNVEHYQEYQYVTSCGEPVLLAIGTIKSLVYADFDECFILMNVLAGSKDGITEDNLKRMADEIDFTVVKDVMLPDDQGDSVITTSDASLPGSSEQHGSTLDANTSSLIDKFLRGEIGAEGNGVYWTDSFYISDLEMDKDAWDAYRVGDRLDLDNDGEDELILSGPYGGMYLDAAGDTVKVFAIGDGTARTLSYVSCDNEVWIVHSDIMHAGRKYYHLQKYAGADHVVERVTLEVQYPSEAEKIYYLNETEISEMEYEKIYQKYFGDIRLSAYRSILEDVYNNQIFPGGRELGYDGFDITMNKFAVYDIDHDGREELLLAYTTTYMAGLAEIIYDYDSTSGTVQEEFMEFPYVTYYDNGIIAAGWSHNQGLAGENFWPYTLYQYNSETDAYDQVGMVDAWDKALSDKNFEGDVFPDQIDVNGDGLVYYIMAKGEYKLDTPVDIEEYEQWRDSYVNGAGMIDVPYMELTEENISKLK